MDQQTNIASVPPQEQKPSFFKKNLYLLIAILVALLIIVGLVVAKYSNNQELNKVTCEGVYKSENFEFTCPQDIYFLTTSEKTPQNYHPNNQGKVEPETYEALSLISNRGKTLGVSVGIVPQNYINVTYQLWTDKMTPLQIGGREAVKYQIQTDNQNEEAYIVPLSAKESLVIKYYPVIAKSVFSAEQLTQLIESITLKDAEYLEGEWVTYENSNFGFSFKHPETVTITQNTDGVSMWPVDKTNASINVYKVGDKKIGNDVYTKLESLRKNFENFKELTSDTDNYEPTGGDAVSYKYVERKIKIDGVPALDRMNCGGGDTCSRTVYVIQGNNIFSIFHNSGYIKYEPDVECGEGCVKPVKPLQRIAEETAFDKILLSFKFTKSVNNVSNLKTFTNQSFGYEIKYPDTYMLKQANNPAIESGTRNIASLELKKDAYPAVEPNTKFLGVTIGIIANKNRNSIDNECQTPSASAVQKDINGNKFLVRAYNATSDFEDQYVNYRDYYLKTNNACYLITASIGQQIMDRDTNKTYSRISKTAEDKLIADIDSIVSTFKLVK